MRTTLRLFAAAAFAFGLAACGNSNTAPPPHVTNAYALQQVIAVPGYTTACLSTTCSFNISFDDPAAQQMYFADRTNKGVSVISTATNTYLGTAGGGSFVGINAVNSNGSGPNGVLSIGGGILYAGDGNSTVKVLNASTAPAVPGPFANPPTATITTVNPTTTGTYPTVCGGAGLPTTGAANNRADEMAFDPKDKVVLVINDAACPPFGTFISTTTNTIVGSIAFPTAGVGGAPGVEQPTWDPTQGVFLVAIPATTANPGGEVDQVSPTTFKVVNVLNAGVGTCNPNGTALGQNENLFLGCAGLSPVQVVTINATTGALVNTISGLGGCDEVWYDPVANHFYGGCSNNPGNPALVIADGNGNQIGFLVTSTGAHSVTADSNTNRVLMPERGGASGPTGVAVYGFSGATPAAL
jgi:hypothetical protein